MVKPLKWIAYVFAHSVKWLVLATLLAVIGLGIWLHEGERTLRFAKPWMEKAINSEDAPFVIGLGDVSVNWTNAAELGKIKIKNVTFARRDGNVFAQFPAVYATIDPLGFLPDRRLLHRVLLREPRMFMVRNREGAIEFGFENSPGRMPLAELIAFFSTEEGAAAAVKPVSLPFRDLIIDNANFTFSDEVSETSITSDAFDFRMSRHHGVYDAILAMPFMVDAQPVMLSAGLRALPKTREHVLAVQMKEFPSRLLCVFAVCPQDISAEGPIDGSIAVGIRDADLSVHGFSAKLATKKATFTAPEWFAEPLKLGASSVAVEGDWSKRAITLNQAKLQLEDTAITANAKLHKAEDGWYATAQAETTRLDVKKLYKYWPLFMAPDSRTWVTSKLKSGYAAKGTLKLNLTPADLAAEYLPEKSVDAIAEAREITFEYLPGFPLVEKMNGTAHFTATTVKVEGSGGTLMGGTKIDHAILWCPELNSDANPMEATLSLTAPASDAVTMLALKHFPFDDHLKLDAKTIAGSVDADIKLKFNAFSKNPSKDPNEIHLEAVDYDITTTMKGIAQKKLAGSYEVKSLNGTLQADNAVLGFDGSLMLGESEINDVTLEQRSGKPLHVTVKGRPAAAGKPTLPLNDFTLTYQSGEVPDITLRGKRLDASISYDSAEHSSLAEFPAMDLDLDLGELVLVPDARFTEVKGTLYCTKLRCESANISARAGDAKINNSIRSVNGKRQFSLTSTDAGELLKAVDITDRMTKGTFDMRGDYIDTLSPPRLDARMVITDFTLKNSQILGRIFSIGSLTGLANMLTGSGIAFEKMAANITSQSGVIHVDKGVANGASMGITVEGSVDTRSSTLNLKGVVAPAYALNSILGKIPVIGAIAGGSEGLIAFNYYVKGSYKEPEVGVNPLSGLTPGFLRGIFSGFDSKPQKNQEDQKKSRFPSGQDQPGAVKKR